MSSKSMCSRNLLATISSASSGQASHHTNTHLGGVIIIITIVTNWYSNGSQSHITIDAERILSSSRCALGTCWLPSPARPPAKPYSIQTHPATVPESHAEPYLEPVDGAAVDERRKHAETIAERVADGTHCEHDVKILLHALYEEVVHRQRRHLKLTTLQCPGEHTDIKKLCTSGFALLFYLPFKI